MVILLAISGDQAKNKQAWESLRKLSDVEVKTVPTTKDLARHVLLPFIEDETGERRYGVMDIKDYVKNHRSNGNNGGRKRKVMA